MTYIIAEIGVNHNGDVAIARKLVDAAKKSGADAAKFQIFITEDEMVRTTPKAQYQKDNGSGGNNMFEMCKALELTFREFRELKKYCDKTKIDFLASIFGLKELDFYVDELGCKTVKFGSGELTNAPLLLATARKKVQIILSTGMADLKDIEFALGVLAFGYTAPKNAVPKNAAFKAAFKSKQGQAALKKNLLVMQCTTQYPCPDEAVNLRAMLTIGEKFGLPVGFSDHSEGIGMACAAVALGAEMIEKHFTLDREMVGPDHLASLDVPQMRWYVHEIRAVEKGLGNGKKIVDKAAAEVAKLACRHIVAKIPIEKGEKFTAQNLTTKRTAAIGVEAAKYYDILGKTASRAYGQDDLISI